MDLKDIDYAIKTKRLRLTFEIVFTNFGGIIAITLGSAYVAINMHTSNTDSLIYLASLIIFFLGIASLSYFYPTNF